MSPVRAGTAIWVQLPKIAVVRRTAGSADVLSESSACVAAELEEEAMISEVLRSERSVASFAVLRGRA